SSVRLVASLLSRIGRSRVGCRGPCCGTRIPANTDNIEVREQIMVHLRSRLTLGSWKHLGPCWSFRPPEITYCLPFFTVTSAAFLIFTSRSDRVCHLELPFFVRRLRRARPSCFPCQKFPSPFTSVIWPLWPVHQLAASLGRGRGVTCSINTFLEFSQLPAAIRLQIWGVRVAETSNY
ncbi:hypothetical protein BGZ61DRAFT_573514, partial [Ilyonectria robusta]|uniref:uncharacterized protein n=1 Tax=Ilyonectria robusta TaxID=1079257 RepID=UPI001E8EAA7C